MCGQMGLMPRLAALCALAGSVLGDKFVIVSSPRAQKIMYVHLGGEGALQEIGDTALAKALPLVDKKLIAPMGLAVDNTRNKLYVADPDGQRVVSYQLQAHGAHLSTASGPVDVVTGVETRWLGVDPAGDLYYSLEKTSEIVKVATGTSLRSKSQPKPEVLYSMAQSPSVNNPGGVAVDSFTVVWGNKALGTQVGAVVQGQQKGHSAGLAKKLTANTDKVYGVCLADGNLFYTDAQERLYGVRADGTGGVTSLSGKAKSPRGCAWDGENSLYIADKGGNALYSLASNMHILEKVQLTKVADIEDAFGVAVFMSSASTHMFSLPILLLALSHLL